MGKSVTRKIAALALIAASFGALDAAIAQASEGTIAGAGEAICEPGPCGLASELQTDMLSEVPNDDGTTSTREYDVYRPQNLVGEAPAVLVFYGSGICGQHVTSRFAELAPANKFIVVYMEIPCGRDLNWDKRNVESQATEVPDDEPYVKAVVDDITRCPGECADPRRLYAAGMSGGGSMVADVMCDVQNSPLFRGYLIDSSSLPLLEGAPHCPSSNRSFFAMLALGDTGLDAGIYHDTAATPHLDVPEFAEWAADRLGCQAPLESGALGSPVASTLTFSYSGPCAYASSGSAAVSSLGIVDGAHGWSCQDSDLGATPNECPTMPSPPGLDAGGLPQTNGLYVEGQFWSFVAEGVSSSTPASPLIETTPPALTIAAPSEGATLSGTVSVDVNASDDTSVASVRLQLDGTDIGFAAPSGQAAAYSLSWDTSTVPDGAHRLTALAVDAAGNLSIASTSVIVSKVVEANPEGEPGTKSGPPVQPEIGPTPQPLPPPAPQTSIEPPRWLALGDDFAAGATGPKSGFGGRCGRSRVAYPVLAASRLRVPAPAVHACAGAQIAAFYRADQRDGQPSQLSWLTGTTKIVSVSVGWNDAGLFAAIVRCGERPNRCRSGWSPTTEAAISSLQPSSTGGHALRNLLKRIAARAPKIVVVGYPRPFPVGRLATCRLGSTSSFDRRAMHWVNGAVRRLDDSIRAAARAAHALYADAYHAFAGHELCSAAPALDASFRPNRSGQLALGTLLARVLGAR
jgi:poly(3-hydroxybutyrate) depolymerase